VCVSVFRTTGQGKNTWVLNYCRLTSKYNPALVESESQNTALIPVTIVPLPDRKGGQRRRTKGKRMRNLN
jgi:hypothetical protein